MRGGRRMVLRIFCLLLVIHTYRIGCTVLWDRLHCASDGVQEMPEGTVADIGRFPWLGVVQHNFYVAGKIHYAVTGAVLIHPAFAIAAAEDIAKIAPEQITNNTRLVFWGSSSNKFVVDVKDYVLHPQFSDRVTTATIALLDLIAWGESTLSDWKAPVRPICMPLKGAGTFDNMYAVKMTDEVGVMEKEIVKMKYVENQVCEEFYYKAQLSYEKMTPINPICAVSQLAKKPCVWDSGAALITRQSWGFWKLIGFAVRGPGCGAPTRFINIHDYLPWINDVISQNPYDDPLNTYKLGIRRVNPYELIIYKAGVPIVKNYGQCERGMRGTILFKDSAELLINKNFVQGFYFLVITMLGEFKCAVVDLEVSRQSQAAIWLEHNCHKDAMGPHFGHGTIMREKMSCYLYFKTAAYLELRFYFSFKANLDVSIYGFEHTKRYIPNPFRSTQLTTPWWPTGGRLYQFGYWSPANKWWWYL